MRTKRNRLRSLVSSIKKGSLALSEAGEKHWRNYYLSITSLVWGRNLQDGYIISVYWIPTPQFRELKEHIGDINIDGGKAEIITYAGGEEKREFVTYL